MKNKWILVASLFQLIVGIAAIATFVLVGLSGESMTKWIITLICAVVFIVLGIIGIMNYRAMK